MSHLRNFIITMMLVIISVTTVLGNAQLEPTKQEKLTMETGENVIVEIYEVPVEATASDLIKDFFYDNDIKYVFSDVEEIENVYVEEKEVVEAQEHISATGNREEIIANLDKSLEYSDDYGYIGTINLDTESLIITENETSTKSWYKSESKTYSNFMYKDNSVIPSTMTNSVGTKLKLQSVSWEVTQQELNGVGELVPTKYNAVANYGATLYSTTVDNYKVEVLYKGTVAKNMVEGKRIEVRYVSVPVENIVDEQSGADVEFVKAIGIIILRLLGLVILILAIAVAILYLIKYLKSLKGVEVYNYFDDGKGYSYVYLGKVTVDIKTPVVDLNHFNEEIQSCNFSFVVDKNTTNRLFGKSIGISLDGVTVMHEIDSKGIEHTFKLDIGDAEDLLGRIAVKKTKTELEDDNFNEEDFYIENNEE